MSPAISPDVRYRPCLSASLKLREKPNVGPKPIEIDRDFILCCERVCIGRLLEAQGAAEPRLCDAPHVGLDHGCNFRIAAGRLRVAHLDDGLPIRRNLDDTRDDAVRSFL